jgi:hypothetical protein
MNKELQQIKFSQEVNAQITRVKIDAGVKDCYVSYNDQYCHRGMSLNTRDTIEYLFKDGAEVIQVYTCGGEEEGSEESLKTFKKIEKIAKKAGYIAEVKGEHKSMKNGTYENKWYEISGILVRKVGV